VLARALVDVAPEASELWAPGGIGEHPDHVQVREAALALGRAGGPPVTMYAELPYAAKRGWPEWVTGRPPRDGLDVDGWLRASLPEGTPWTGERHVLSRAEARRKLRALRSYWTQWAALDAGPDRAVSHPRVIRYEASFAALSTPAPSTPGRSPAGHTQGTSRRSAPA
jgi:LmbE family N-acetylglucosaminyl deacetylase